MKKALLIILVILLALVLVAAVAACVLLPKIYPEEELLLTVQEWLGMEIPTQPTQQTQPTTEPLPPPTEPPETAPRITWEVYPQERPLTAQKAFVYDCVEDEFLYTQGNAGERVYPASITKLLTAYVALEILDKDSVVTVGDAVEMIGYNSSVAGLKKGDKLTVEMLVKAMLLPSGNDASYVMAEAAGRHLAQDPALATKEAVAVFMEEVNQQAGSLGLTGTHFTCPDGYHDDNHYTTMYDLAKIGQLAMENDLISKYTSFCMSEVKLTSGKTVLWANTNALVNPTSDFYCPYAVGLKTGRTTEAGNCLLSAFKVGRQEYIIGVFGCPESEGRFADTLDLLNDTLGVTP